MRSRTTPASKGTPAMMLRSPRFLLYELVALVLIAATPAIAASDDEPFDVAEIFFELNHTDGDLGLHGFVDGDAWKQLTIGRPKKSSLLQVTVQGRLKQQGMTELFFESAEPGFDELSPDQFFERFPEGTYVVKGVTLDGEKLKSEVEISHVMPAPAGNIEISGVSAAENCDADPLPAVSPPIVISWDPVTTSHPDIGADGDVEIAEYELVLEFEDGGLEMSVHLPPSVTAMEVPSAFIGLADSFKFEILARDVNGNRTAVESCFEVD
jgi:hypothetical protein